MDANEALTARDRLKRYDELDKKYTEIHNKLQRLSKAGDNGGVIFRIYDASNHHLFGIEDELINKHLYSVLRQALVVTQLELLEQKQAI